MSEHECIDAGYIMFGFPRLAVLTEAEPYSREYMDDVYGHMVPHLSCGTAQRKQKMTEPLRGGNKYVPWNVMLLCRTWIALRAR